MAQMGGDSMEIGKDMAIPLFASVVAGGTALTGGCGGPAQDFIWSDYHYMDPSRNVNASNRT